MTLSRSRRQSKVIYGARKCQGANFRTFNFSCLWKAALFNTKVFFFFLIKKTLLPHRKMGENIQINIRLFFRLKTFLTEPNEKKSLLWLSIEHFYK